ncbi:MAG TPA: hypothetical protein VGK34_10110 [Armatimonadota bacterium]|jgi:hypothetical protein
MRKTIAAAMVLAVLTPTLALPSFAGEAGRRNTALVLTGAAVNSALHKDKGTAAALGIGAVAAWSRYADSGKGRHTRHFRGRHHNERYYRNYRDEDRGHRGDRGKHKGWDKRDHQPRGHAYGHYKKHGHDD